MALRIGTISAPLEEDVSLKKIVGMTLVLLALVPVPNVNAETRRAKRVQAIDGQTRCVWARDRFVTVISGPCDKYTPPRELRVGETFQANGKVKTINVILADRITKDLPSAA